MPVCAQCQRPFDGDACPSCGSRAESSPQGSWSFIWYAIVPIGGLIGALLTTIEYNLVEKTPITLACFLIGMIAVLPGSHYKWRRRPPSEAQAELVKKFYVRVGSVLVAVAVLLFANCALDSKSPAQFKASVVSKYSQKGYRGGDTYYLTVAPSWRAGRADEEVEVNPEVYATFRIGETVVVEVHGGLFHIPWYGAISRPES
ncbi:MAG TPA: hypothetical protein VMM16_11400 [Verrucomicrobiae bacterium]|nr:hypothetical protein [Verrucomicrobiae bacterium]